MIDIPDIFDAPSDLHMRRYEAIRAYVHEKVDIHEAAARGNYTVGSFRNILTRYKKNPSPDFFWPRLRQSTPKPKRVDPRPALILALRKEQNLSLMQIQEALKRQGLSASNGYIQKIFNDAGIPRLPRGKKHPLVSRSTADHRQLDLTPRTFDSDFAGLFLFAFDLARMNLGQILNEVNMPGTRMIPPTSAILSLLALKLAGVGRPSHVMAEADDEGLALFTGLNVIPKRTTLTEYSITIDPNFSAPLMHRWYHMAVNLSKVIGAGQSVDLDFHTIPYHGDQALVQKHYISKRSRRQRGILTVLARDADSRVICYADTTLRKETQNDAIFDFVDDWKARTGNFPIELVFDSRFTTYANLHKLNELGIHFITLRRRHAALVRRIHTLDPKAWKSIRLSNIGRAYRNPSIVEERTTLRTYPTELRQILVKGLGHDKPTIVITNQMDRSASQLIDRYARRMVIENVISDAIDFFHMDALSSAVPMRINVDAQLTIMASTLYRLMGVRVGDGYETAEARTIYRDLARLSGKIILTDDEVIVRLRNRAKTGYLIAAGYQNFREKIPWLNNKTLRVEFHKRP